MPCWKNKFSNFDDLYQLELSTSHTPRALYADVVIAMQGTYSCNKPIQSTYPVRTVCSAAKNSDFVLILDFLALNVLAGPKFLFIKVSL